MSDLTPREIIKQLDAYVIGQEQAKRSVSIALRNRWRRMQLSEEARRDILPKNIIMIGPTGCGKTEIARRMALLTNAPFLKIEASKFTEVGYVGRDVETIIRDLTEAAIDMERRTHRHSNEEQARAEAEKRILDILLPNVNPLHNERHDTRDEMLRMLRNKELDDKEVEIEVSEKNSFLIGKPFGGGMDNDMRDMLSGLLPTQKRKRRLKVAAALEVLTNEEVDKLLDNEDINQSAIHNVENNGIVFLDEVDKIIAKRGELDSASVSREGVQRDLLPIVEGTSVNTRYGTVKTDHILFIAAGAFHVARPSDLIPELQGRFPIRVELKPLSTEDFRRILTEPKNALTTQYQRLLGTEGVSINFTSEAITEIATIASQLNLSTENIGARRLHTLLEKILEEVSFEAPEIRSQSISITPEYIQAQLNSILKSEDLSRYIL